MKWQKMKNENSTHYVKQPIELWEDNIHIYDKMFATGAT